QMVRESRNEVKTANKAARKARNEVTGLKESLAESKLASETWYRKYKELETDDERPTRKAEPAEDRQQPADELEGLDIDLLDYIGEDDGKVGAKRLFSDLRKRGYMTTQADVRRMLDERESTIREENRTFQGLGGEFPDLMNPDSE